MKVLLELFLTFAKIGAFTFGGGYAMFSLIEDICVEKRKWITHDEMMDIIVIAESTPGPVAINCATYVGYKKAKLPGAVFATIGMILPSFFIIYIISRFLDNFMEISWVANAFHGIKLAVSILILDAAIKMLVKGKLTIVQKIVFVISFAAMMVIDFFALNISTLIIMLFAAIVGMVTFFVNKNKTKEVAGE